MITEWKNLTKSTKTLKTKVDNLDIGFDDVLDKLDNLVFMSKIAMILMVVVILQLLLVVSL